MERGLFQEYPEIKRYIRIARVQKSSIADELGIEVGDNLIRINGQEIRDFIDYKFLLADTYLEVEVISKDDEYWVFEIEKDYNDDLGIEFDNIVFDGLKECHNDCIFCFVKQTPPNTRKTLNLKDDDYRFSFLGGSYTTLTNLNEEEMNRIKRLHLSPLNISVHSTNPQVRVEMLKNKKAGGILKQLKGLAEAGIEMNTQIVLCPGINDGKYLEQTISDLVDLIPHIRSLAIVPVGLTKYRDKQEELRCFTAKEAEQVIKIVEEWQAKLRAEYGFSFLHLSDEFYLLADIQIPSTTSYDDFLQLENGVGMVRLFLDEFKQIKNKMPSSLDKERKVSIITSVSGAKAINPVINRLQEIDNLEIKLLIVKNKYFGDTVTVTGLLTGQDILTKLSSVDDLGDLILIPEIVLNDDQLFLDNLSWEKFSNSLSNQVIGVKNSAVDLINKVLGDNYGGVDND